MTPVDIDKLKEQIARIVKGARLSAAFGREFRAGDGRLDDVDLDAAGAIIALPALIAKAERVDALERALTEDASTFDQFAAALREHDPAAMAQEIAVAELAAAEARNALSPKPEDAAP